MLLASTDFPAQIITITTGIYKIDCWKIPFLRREEGHHRPLSRGNENMKEQNRIRGEMFQEKESLSPNLSLSLQTIYWLLHK
jgi:hypothetical protein